MKAETVWLKRILVQFRRSKKQRFSVHSFILSAELNHFTYIYRQLRILIKLQFLSFDDKQNELNIYFKSGKNRGKLAVVFRSILDQTPDVAYRLSIHRFFPGTTRYRCIRNKKQDKNWDESRGLLIVAVSIHTEV